MSTDYKFPALTNRQLMKLAADEGWRFCLPSTEPIQWITDVAPYESVCMYDGDGYLHLDRGMRGNLKSYWKYGARYGANCVDAMTDALDAISEHDEGYDDD